MGYAAALALCAAFGADPARGGADGAQTPTPKPPPQAAPAVPAARPSALVPPPPRAPIAGLRGFESRSRIEYPAQPGRLHDLRAAYVFPERVRWWIAARDGATEQRRLRYQYGQHVLAVEPRQAESVEYRAEDRAALIAAFELRRALFLWPDDRAWTGEDESRKCVLPNGDELRAKLAGAPPRPVEMEYTAAGQAFHDSFRAITWRADGARAWPATFEVWNGSTLAWREAVDAVDVETRYIDSFFVPPDRRGVAGVAIEGVRDLDIPPACVRRVELAPATTWDAARAERARLLAEAQKAGLPALEDWVTLEVGADAAPTAVLLRLARVPDRAPEGYAVLPDRLGTATSVRGLAAVGPQVLGRLAARLPPGAAAGRAYVRFDGQRPAGDVVVVLPLD